MPSLLSSFLPAFFASIVEFVEALTVVLAIGVSVNWKSSLWGAGAAVAALGSLIGVFGTSLVVWVPIAVLRLVVGVVLVLFGLQWLRKSLLRYAGLKALHDEGKIYQREVAAAQARGAGTQAFSGFGFATSFKSVLLEGLEVAFIVITFGATAASDKAATLRAASLGALAAFVLVLVVGLVVRKPLTRIPENTLKFIVGVMLVSFGLFWAGEGLGVAWPGEDAFILGLLALTLGGSALGVGWLRRRSAKPGAEGPALAGPARWAWEVFDFLCGDWWVFGGLAVTLTVVAGLGAWAPTPAKAFLGVVWVLGTGISFGWSLARQTEAPGSRPRQPA